MYWILLPCHPPYWVRIFFFHLIFVKAKSGLMDEYEVSKETVGSCGYSKREWCDKRYRGMKYYGVFEGIRIRFVLGKHKGQCRNREIVVVGEWKMVVTGDGVVRTELQWHSGGPRTKDMELFLKASAMWQSEEEISPGWNSIFQKILKSRAIILFLLSQKQVQIERWRTLAKIIQFVNGRAGLWTHIFVAQKSTFIYNP